MEIILIKVNLIEVSLIEASLMEIGLTEVSRGRFDRGDVGELIGNRHHVVYCGWLRDPAPPKGWLKPYEQWDKQG